MTKIEAATEKAIARYTAGGGNESHGRVLLADSSGTVFRPEPVHGPGSLGLRNPAERRSTGNRSLRKCVMIEAKNDWRDVAREALALYGTRLDEADHILTCSPA
jgi:hypothetical protein